MHAQETETLSYGHRLVNAGIDGVRNGRKSFDPQVASALVLHSAEESLKLAALGACLAILPACLVRRQSRASTAVALGAVGSALGFLTAFSWKTRRLTSVLAHSAMREVRRVNDEHWLETNPIDYA